MHNEPVVVIGGGISGVTAALNLAQHGIAVDLVEREPRLGGNALTVSCKAVNGQCQHCGGCLVADSLHQISAMSHLRVDLSSRITAVQHSGKVFNFQLDTPHGLENRIAQAVIVATGFDHVDARTKGPYGYGILPMVITGEDMERRLRDEGQAAFDAPGPREIAFIQCVGSRDEHAGRGWCSQVCCRYGVRMARLLKARSPQTNVTVFKMDIQTAGRDSQAFALAQQEGIRFVCGIPAVIRRSERDLSKAVLLFDDIHAGQFREQEFDLVVLSTGIEPRHDAAELAEILRVERSRFGFLDAGWDETALDVAGVFAAGCCQSPRSIPESIAHATTAAENCLRYLMEMASD